MNKTTHQAGSGSHFPLKCRLAAMGFLEFGVWGAYLTSLGAYLARNGMGDHIGWFYAVQGIVSIFMPGLVGIVADRWIQAQKVLSLCHLLAGLSMLAAGIYGLESEQIAFTPLFTLYTISVAFFMPTIGLSNSVAYSALEGAGLDSVKHFPPIRVFGTVGFICAMLFVNFTGFQNTAMQLVCSGVLSLCLTVYALTMPKCPVAKNSGKKGLASSLGLDAFKLFKNPQMAGFFLFSMCLGVSLQITNGFANPFIQSFGQLPEYADTFGVQNANALISLSQMSETLCILLIPFFLKRFGIKTVMLMAMFAWVLRFGFFGIGNPGGGVWLFILSMIVYGVAFDFFNVSGSLYVDQKTGVEIRSSAQGLFMIMTNGIGATLGTLGAQAVVSHFVFSQPEGEAQIAGWSTSWLIFAAYALVIAILFLLLFKDHDPHGSEVQISEAEAAAAQDDAI
ncbi:MAG: nucleoside permease [Muribaculaceae bacterium]|nr:nucleoside permease [Muribaculaceae bacterium]